MFILRNMENNSGAEIFDVDHTITRNITSLSYLNLLIKKKIFSITILRYWPFLTINYNFGKMNDRHFNKRLDELVGIEEKFLDEVAAENFSNMLRKNYIFSGAKKLISELKAQGKIIILATSSMETVIKPLADYLGADAVIATKFEYKDGKCTGQFQGKVAFREVKRIRVLDYLREHDLSPADSSFYSDSIHDYPLFKEVGNPVAVNPDIRLRHLARKNNWKILNFKKNI